MTDQGSFNYDFIIRSIKKREPNVNLLLYYDAPDQWPSVYPSNKSCEEKESILSISRGQLVPLSLDPGLSKVSGCRRLNDSLLTTDLRCTSYRKFKSARPRWWFIALADCSSDSGLNITYNISMTNGPPGSFWREHFSADEFCKYPQIIIKFKKKKIIQIYKIFRYEIIYFSRYFTTFYNCGYCIRGVTHLEYLHGISIASSPSSSLDISPLHALNFLSIYWNFLWNLCTLLSWFYGL